MAPMQDSHINDSLFNSIGFMMFWTWIQDIMFTLYLSCFSKNMCHKKLGIIFVPVASYHHITKWEISYINIRKIKNPSSFICSPLLFRGNRGNQNFKAHELREIKQHKLSKAITMMMVAFRLMGINISLPMGPMIVTFKSLKNSISHTKNYTPWENFY